MIVDADRSVDGAPGALLERLSAAAAPAARIELDRENVRQGLLKLVLTLVKILHEVLERQAIHRVEGGTLSASQIEAIGATLKAQRAEITRLREEFGLKEEDLDLNLGGILDMGAGG